MNLMHEDIKITDEIYAPILSNEVKTRIEGLTSPASDHAYGELVDIFSHLSNTELAKVMLAAAHRLVA